jgi:hypothetical protein
MGKPMGKTRGFQQFFPPTTLINPSIGLHGPPPPEIPPLAGPA